MNLRKTVLLLSIVITLNVHSVWAQAETKSPGKKLRLAFITTCIEAKFFAPVRKGMQDAAQQMGVEADFLGTLGVDIPKQVAMVRQAVADGYDGIALNIIHAEAFDQVVQETINRGVPVVAFNVDDYQSENARLSSVNQDYYQAGQTLAKHVADKIPNNSLVLLTQHDSGVSSLDDRARGIQDALRDKQIRWITAITGSNAIAGAKVVEAVLEKSQNTRIILCTGQADTEAAGRAIEALGVAEDIWCAGFDLSPKTLQLIQQGIIRCTIDQQPYTQGFYPVVQLVLKLRYGITPYDLDAGAAIIDPSNAARVVELTKAGYR